MLLLRIKYVYERLLYMLYALNVFKTIQLVLCILYKKSWLEICVENIRLSLPSFLPNVCSFDPVVVYHLWSLYPTQSKSKVYNLFI